MKMTTRYSGKSGLYASVTPVMGYQRFMAAMASQFHHLDLTPVDDVHCTLIYSREEQPHALRVAQAITEGPFQFTAFPKEVKYWDGHDNKGYIVLGLDSPDLHKRHHKWKLLGAKHSFPDYEAHITLAKGLTAPSQAWLDECNHMLELMRMPIIFGGEHVEDIKG